MRKLTLTFINLLISIMNLVLLIMLGSMNRDFNRATIDAFKAENARLTNLEQKANREEMSMRRMVCPVPAWTITDLDTGKTTSSSHVILFWEWCNQ